MPAPRLRRLVAAAGLLAGAALSAPTAFTAPLPAETVSKVVAADIAFINKAVEKAPSKGAFPTIRQAALNVAASTDAATSKAALAVADAAAKKDYAATKSAADALAKVKPGAGNTAPAKIAEAAKIDLHVVMSAYRAEKPGGMNLEKDIKTQGKSADPAKAEIIAGRSALLAQFTAALPEGKAAANAANKAKWEKISKDQLTVSEDIAAEAAKGAKADKAAISKKMTQLEATCTACHNEFRD